MTPRHQPNTARGFSMIELMVAVVLALLVTGAVISVFVGARSASIATSGVAAYSDAGRFALDFIEQSVRSGGFMGCNTTNRTVNILNPGTSQIYYDFAEPLFGYEAKNTNPTQIIAVAAAPVADGATADWLTFGIPGDSLDPALAALAAAPQGGLIQGSDVLVVNGTLNSQPPVYTTAQVNVGAVSVPVNSVAGLSTGQLGILSNCAQSAVFEITNTSGSAVQFSGGTAPGNATSLSLDFSEGSQVAVADTIVYYIGVGADGDGALFSYDTQGFGTFEALPMEVVPDIENMQVLYGIDTDGSLTVSQYVPADQVSNLSFAKNFGGVMSIKVAILAASPPNSTAAPAVAQQYNLLGTLVNVPIDTRMRKVFDMTISLRNMGT